VLWAGFPGQEFGPALRHAAVLTVDLELDGRLPVTIACQDSDYCAFDFTPAKRDLEYAGGSATKVAPSCTRVADRLLENGWG
jgi:beta-glucosidase